MVEGPAAVPRRDTVNAGQRCYPRNDWRLVVLESLLGIRSDVGLLVVRATIEPSVWGVWRTASMLPETMSEELSEPELKQ